VSLLFLVSHSLFGAITAAQGTARPPALVEWTKTAPHTPLSQRNPPHGSRISFFFPLSFTSLQFAVKRGDGALSTDQQILSAVVGNMLYVIDVANAAAVPLAFKFSELYGPVKSYSWLSTSFVVVAFEGGQIVGYSTARSDQEVFCISAPGRITAFAHSPALDQLAVAAGRLLRVYRVTQSDCLEQKDLAMDFDYSQVRVYA
jgi:hypothetical protein